ncbi:MAG: hypothetical protein Udaeo2_12720 [Candidatus Udaeobacter sp.]|nr:MAG: hypothetical protein Udaeo2_12720 [Candidatus Udaeobacter sp.]
MLLRRHAIDVASLIEEAEDGSRGNGHWVDPESGVVGSFARIARRQLGGRAAGPVQEGAGRTRVRGLATGGAATVGSCRYGPWWAEWSLLNEVRSCGTHCHDWRRRRLFPAVRSSREDLRWVRRERYCNGVIAL